ncbi:MAG: DUF4388 domain-containing protein [Acidobacteria bacterium]|nr:DUF4388 domain-containing protein [Acidobacteriota bacterium]
MALTGHLSDLSLSELIEFFCNQRKTGQLKVLYPQGPGYFYLQTGSVVDARIGVLRGIDAVYYALTLPNAKFEFGDASESSERSINQPWTQVVLEGLRRLDEGIVPTNAFPPDYHDENDSQTVADSETSFSELESLRVPSFLSFMGTESLGNRKFVIAGVVGFAVLASIAAIGVPAGWYGQAKTAAVANQAASTVATNEPSSPAVSEVAGNGVGSSESSPTGEQNDEVALAAKRQREKEKARAREERASTLNQPASARVPANVAAEAGKPGSKKITVNASYPGIRWRCKCDTNRSAEALPRGKSRFSNYYDSDKLKRSRLHCEGKG